MTEEIMQVITDNVYGIWFLIGAVLVFWMQAGFAMVESGFTRAKNAGNIIMKNLMDFCIGTIMWFLIGASLMLAAGEGKSDILGFMGDSGYGPEGTFGQFAVHLHLGIYIYPNDVETSVNPYWVLRYIEKSKVKCYTKI